MLTVGDLEAARAAAAELTEIADAYDTPALRAVADHGRGAVLLTEGDARGALVALRGAWQGWQALQAPYEGARVRMLLGIACRAFAHGDAAKAHGLTARELQILRLLATGTTNRVIAGKLFVTEKTVDRHVSNIFTKLGVSSRAAATAYAYRHRLL